MLTKYDIVKGLNDPLYINNMDDTDLKNLVESYPYCESLHHMYLRKLFVSEDVYYPSQLSASSMHISNRKYLYEYLNFSGYEVEEVAFPNIAPVTNDYFAIEGNENRKQSLQALAKKLRDARLAKQNMVLSEAMSVAVQEVQPIVGDDVTDESTLVPKSDIALELENDNEIQKSGQQNLSNAELQLSSDDYFFSLSRNVKNSSADDLSALAFSVNDSPITDSNVDSAVNKKEKEAFAKKVGASVKSEENVIRLIKEKKYAVALEILKEISLNNPKKSVYFAVQMKYLETILENINR